jgi:hypothetical protein
MRTIGVANVNASAIDLKFCLANCLLESITKSRIGLFLDDDFIRRLTGNLADSRGRQMNAAEFFGTLDAFLEFGFECFSEEFSSLMRKNSSRSSSVCP